MSSSDEDSDTTTSDSSTGELAVGLARGQQASDDEEFVGSDDDDTLVPPSDGEYSLEEPPDPDNDRLTWRMDPEESHSDWTIEIITTGSEKSKKQKTETYHVHKNILAVGAKKSEYFVRLFASSNCFVESKRQTSRIELEELAAEAFPVMLDYFYSNRDELRIDTMNAAVLYYLGQYFEADRLRWEARKFWKQDMNIENCNVYYEHAEIFHDDKIMKAVVKTCCDNLTVIEPDSVIVEISAPEFWIQVLKFQDWGSASLDDEAKHLSVLIAQFCILHQDELDSETFLALTNPDDLPKIHHEAAEPLMDLEKSIVLQGSDSRSGTGTGSTTITSLQLRCVDAMASQWETLDVSTKASVNSLSRFSPAVLSNLLARSLKNARRDKKAAASPKRLLDPKTIRLAKRPRPRKIIRRNAS